MRDFLGYRKIFGVITPSINTCVQPEYDSMRPPGVTNQVARMQGSDVKVQSDADFEQVVKDLLKSIDPAIDQVVTCRPDHVILGISALAVWGGSKATSDALKQSMKQRAGGKMEVSLATDAIVEALKAHGEEVHRDRRALLSGHPAPHAVIFRRARLRGRTVQSYEGTAAYRIHPRHGRGHDRGAAQH